MRAKINEIAYLNLSNYKFSKENEIIKYLDTSSVDKGVFLEFQTLQTKIDEIPSRAKRAVKNGTTVISTVRPNLLHYGYFDKPDKNIVVSTGFVTIDAKSNIIDSKYLYCVLTSSFVTNYLIKISSTAVSSYPSFNSDDLGNLVIEFPEDIKEQQKIAKQIFSINSKIKNNTKINSELESMAKTLYDYWFLQFEFPNAEGKPYKSSGGKMVYNEELKREIPEGWKVKHTSDIAEIKTGKEDANHSTENGQYPFFTCSNDILKCDDYKFEGNAILIAGNGDFNVKHYKGKFNAYQRTYVIKPYEEKHIGLFNMCCKQTIEKFKKGSNGSIVKFITLGDIQNIQMLDGFDDSLLKPFNKYLEMIDSLKKENQELASLRDFLLPLLMNGQVTFKD